MTMFGTVAAFESALASLPNPDAAASAAASARQNQLTKPQGSLGRLEDIAIFLAGWQGRAIPRLDTARAVVFAGNHGIAARGVSAFPPSVTAQMVQNFEAGGAAINALARAAGLELVVVPIDLDTPTADFTQAPAMSEAECLAALQAGAGVVEAGIDLLVLGEMGIGNSTIAAALCARSFGGSGVDWVGPGTGVDDAGRLRKIAAVDAGLAVHVNAPVTAFETLRRVGGREIAAIAGAVLAARMAGVPVVLDGYICCAAVAPLVVAAPDIVAHCIAGHRSAEPAHRRLLKQFGLEPLMCFDMRLGEGSGAALAAGVIRAAVAVHAEMATFAEAGVSEG